jgi:hypothetical protein
MQKPQDEQSPNSIHGISARNDSLSRNVHAKQPVAQQAVILRETPNKAKTQ